MDPLDYIARWERRLSLALEQIKLHGADVRACFRADRPAPHVLRDASTDLGRPIPEALRRLLEQCAALRGGWHLTDERGVALPEATHGVLWGGVDLSVKEVVDAETSRRGWVRECFPNRDDPYDVVWHDKFAFHTVPNGDCLAMGDDDRGAVYYLSHDDGEGHGVILGTSIEDFFDRWSALAFAGPEDWLLAPFLRADTEGLDAMGSAASEWRSALALEDMPAA